jgi:hypothetical protein
VQYKIAILAWSLALSATTQALPQPPEKSAPAKPQAPTEQFQALVKQHKEVQQAFFKAAKQAKTADEQKKLVYPSPEKYRKQIFDLALNNPKEPFAVDALVWLVQNGGSDEALEILARDHLKDKRIGAIGRNLGDASSPNAEKLLRAILDNEIDREARGQACLALARYLKHKADQAGSKDTTEAQKYFELAVEKYADVTYFSRQKIGDTAKGALFEIRNLGIGMTAPEIEAKDLDGKSFKLSDYRGKVVLLDFWGNW